MKKINVGNLSLAEISELYVKNKENFDTVHSIVNSKPKTFSSLSLKEAQELYTQYGQSTLEYYKNNPTEEIVEFKKGFTSLKAEMDKVDKRKTELYMLRQQLELERVALELDNMKRELGIESNE